MNHELIPLVTMPTIPMSFSCQLRRGGTGWIYKHDVFYVVVDREPICAGQAMQMMMQRTKTIPPCAMNYLYAASLFYRKSRNPHGPSARPIYIAALEHAVHSCEYEPQGVWSRFTGSAPSPKTVFLGLFHATGRINLGKRTNDFTDSSACSLLLTTAASKVGLGESDFELSGSASQGPECPSIQ